MEYNDYELVSLAQECNEDAVDILHKKYKDKIISKSKKVFCLLKNKGLELSDVVQEAMIGFEEAIKCYNQDSDAIFYTFSMLCVDRRLNSLIIKYNRNKYKILNETITLDYDDEFNLYNFIGSDFSVEKNFFGKEETRSLYKKIKCSLTDFEEDVIDLKIYGYNYNEISDILNVDSKDVYNTINRIRGKVSKILNK